MGRAVGCRAGVLQCGHGQTSRILAFATPGEAVSRERRESRETQEETCGKKSGGQIRVHNPPDHHFSTRDELQVGSHGGGPRVSPARHLVGRAELSR